MKKLILATLSILMMAQGATATEVEVNRGKKIVFLRKTLEELDNSKENLEFKKTVLLHFGDDRGINYIFNNAEIVTAVVAPAYAYGFYKHYYGKRAADLKKHLEYLKASPYGYPDTVEKAQAQMEPKNLKKYALGQATWWATIGAAVGTEVTLRVMWHFYNHKYSDYRNTIENMTAAQLQDEYVQVSEQLDEIIRQTTMTEAELQSIEGTR
jgi:hypothetical protein